MKRSPSLHPTSSIRGVPQVIPQHTLDRQAKNVYAYFCELCGEKSAKYVCSMCKRYVCEDHFDRQRGICIACIEALCTLCHRNLSIGHCCICGRRICHGCAIDIDGVRRICYSCIIGKPISYLRLILRKK